MILTFTLNITTLAQITTPEEKKAVEEELKELPKEEQEKVKEELEITKPTELSQPNIFEKAGEGISQITSVIANAVKQSLEIATGFALAMTKEVFNTIGSRLAFVGNKIGQGFNTIGEGYNNLANNAPGIAKTILTGIGDGVSTFAYAVGNTAGAITDAAAKGINNTKDGIANAAFAVGEKTQDISEGVGFAFVKVGYLFVNEPTRIYDVEAAVLSPTSAKISWESNHPASGKVNWGLASGDYGFEQQTDNRTTQHEFVLTNLEPDTEYHFEVMSQNKNYVYDANRKFRTLK